MEKESLQHANGVHKVDVVQHLLVVVAHLGSSNVGGGHLLGMSDGTGQPLGAAGGVAWVEFHHLENNSLQLRTCT